MKIAHVHRISPRHEKLREDLLLVVNTVVLFAIVLVVVALFSVNGPVPQ